MKRLLVKFHQRTFATPSTTQPLRFASSIPSLGGPQSASRLHILLWLFPAATQVQRLQWKLNLIEKTTEKLNSPAAAFKEFLNSSSTSNLSDSDLQFQKVKISGKFAEGRDMHVGLRSRGTAADGKGSQGMATNPQGYFVFSPFDVDSSEGVGKLRILINRGWIPRSAGKSIESQELRKISDAKVTIEAVLRLGENPASFPKNDPHSDQWYSIDVHSMSQWAASTKGHNDIPQQTMLVFDLINNSELNAPLLAREGAPLARNGSTLQIKNDHFVYAVTWFGMCGFSAAALIGSSGGIGGRGRLVPATRLRKLFSF
ncbi:Surfeit locus protein 1 [Physocladia obscura]|uniref:SURF1-like protein n=1 Tax=Physocladia obscura TaxID=109957 RepID=A0AAD5T0M0_9FUNG|nr:Surfeit locus protein 1 [Physocladia obscura]